MKAKASAAVLLFALASAAATAALGQPAPGAAGTQGEAPGAAPLAGTPPAVAETPAEAPAAQRRMSFEAGGAECRETVPGGPMLAIAYAIVLVVMGAYVALLAHKNARLTNALADLEAEFNRRRPAPPGGGEGT